MVGTTRFELATSPTPRVRSTRLSHVPTYHCLRRLIEPARGAFSLPPAAEIPAAPQLMRRRHVLLRQFAASAEEELVHLFHKELLGLACPRLQAILIQQHLLPFQPLVPCLHGHIFVDFLSKIRVKRRLVESFHLLLILRAEHHMRHRSNLLFPSSVSRSL